MYRARERERKGRREREGEGEKGKAREGGKERGRWKGEGERERERGAVKKSERAGQESAAVYRGRVSERESTEGPELFAESTSRTI